MTDRIRIATRKSPLALWQAEHVKQLLMSQYPQLTVELVSMTTEGDRFLEAPLATVGGKGLFIKELEQCLLDNKADIAVHSMKDVTVDFPDGLELAVIMQRDDPRDAWISNEYGSIESLPNGAVVGTSSMRRQCQIRAVRPDLVIKDLRGNVGTRLNKLDDGQYDGIILATAGVKRLGLEQRIKEYISPEIMLPAIGQAAIGIETRSDDQEIQTLLAPLSHEETNIRVNAERALSRRLYGGCQLPIAAHAVIHSDILEMRALVGRIDGSEIIKDSIQGNVADAEQMGTQLAEMLLQKGADKILDDIIHD